jgi:hypothetical protein
MVSVVLWAMAVGAGLYAIVVVLLFGLQGRLVFPLDPFHDEPAKVGLADMDVIALGNGESLSGRADNARNGRDRLSRRPRANTFLRRIFLENG